MSGAIGDDGSQAQEEKKGTLFHAGDIVAVLMYMQEIR